MTTLIVLRGLPGSGKTTRAREYVRTRRGRAGIVCRDTVREHVLGLSMTAGDAVLDAAGEAVVTDVVEAMAGALLAAGCDVVADATNLTDQYVDQWRALGDRYGARVEGRR